MRATPNTIATDNITRRRMLQGLTAMLADASVVLSATAANTAPELAEAAASQFSRSACQSAGASGAAASAQALLVVLLYA